MYDSHDSHYTKDGEILEIRRDSTRFNLRSKPSERHTRRNRAKVRDCCSHELHNNVKLYPIPRLLLPHCTEREKRFMRKFGGAAHAIENVFDRNARVLRNTLIGYICLLAASFNYSVVLISALPTDSQESVDKTAEMAGYGRRKAAESLSATKDVGGLEAAANGRYCSAASLKKELVLLDHRWMQRWDVKEDVGLVPFFRQPTRSTAAAKREEERQGEGKRD